MSSPQFAFETTAEEAATALAAEIRGKNVLITGTSLNGIGFEAARVIAKYANLVIITGYNEERLKLSEAAIKTAVPSANIRRVVLDLSSISSIRRAADEVNALPENIHVLVNNAAAPIAPFKLAPELFNLEVQIATDHFGPFLLTKLLLPKLLATKTTEYTPRIVFVASGAHAWGTGVDLEEIKAPKAKNHTPAKAYFQAKSANILTASELSRRAAGKVLAFSLHPGVIYSNINRKDESAESLQSIGILDADGNPSVKMPWKTIEQGAATTVVAAFDPRLNTASGAYLNDSVVANNNVAAHSADPEVAKALWELTEEVLGEKLVF